MAGLYNHTKGARRLGNLTIPPKMAAVVADESWRTNAVVAQWVKDGDLEKVSDADVEKINAGMAIEMVKAETTAKAKEAEKTPAPKA